MKTIATLMAVAAIASCSNDEDRAKKQAECDNIAADIREKATTQYNQPAEGACNNPALKPQFDKACASLAKCQEELTDM